MPERIVGVDITSDAVTAVQVTSRVKGYEVTSCGHVSIEEAGGMEAALKTLAGQMGVESDVCISALPGDVVSCRNLRMPFKDSKKIRQTLAYELETNIPFPVEGLIIDFTTIEESEETEILSAFVSRAWISEHLSQLRAAGVEPSVLDISGVPAVSWLLRRPGTPDDGLFLKMDRTRNTVILFLKRRIALIRTLPFNGRVLAATNADGPAGGDGSPDAGTQVESSLREFCTEIKNTLHAFSVRARKAMPEKVFLTGIGALYPGVDNLLSRYLDLPVERLDFARDPRIHVAEGIAGAWNPAIMDNALAVAMRDGKQGLGFNFRRDEFEVSKGYLRHKKEIAKVGALLGIILCLLSLDFGIEYYFLKKQSRQLEQRIQEVFQQTLPDVKRIVDPVQQMRVKINETKKVALSLPGVATKGTVLDLLKDISLRAPEAADIDMARITVDPEVVLIKGETDTFNTVDAIKKGLEPSTYFNAVTISSANLERSTNRVEFEIKLQRIQAEPAGSEP